MSVLSTINGIDVVLFVAAVLGWGLYLSERAWKQTTSEIDHIIRREVSE